MKRWLSLRRIALAALVLLLVAAVIAPFVGAERFSTVLHSKLEQQLGRRVDLRGEVRFRILPRPGFTIEEPGGGSVAIIHERPEFGLEPLAYVEALALEVSLPALFTGKLELSGIRLLNPSINLTKLEDRWNIQPIVEHALTQTTTLPEIEVTGGRLNFKTGDRKSAFYLAETDLHIDADTTDSSRFGIRVEGEPARTDRSTRAFGRLTARGMLSLARRSAGEPPRLDISLALERTAVAEIATLLTGRPTGLSGFVASHLRLSGPLSALSISGRVEGDQVERLSLLPRNNPAVNIQGTLDLPGQRLDLATQDSAGPFGVRLRGARLFSRPEWSANILLRDYPISSVRTLLEEIGAMPAGDLPLAGVLSGALGWSLNSPASGQFELRQAQIMVDGQPPLELHETRMTVAGSKLILHPSTARLEEGAINVSAELDSGDGTGEVRIQTKGLPIATFRGISQRLLRTSPPWLLTDTQGSMSGQMMLRNLGAEALWSGQVRLQGNVSSAPIGSPFRLESALVSFNGESIEMRRISGSIGAMRFSGDYSTRAAKEATHIVRIQTPEASLAECEDLLRVIPWRKAGRVEAAVTIGTLIAGETEVGSVRGRIYVNQDVVLVRDLTGQLNGAALIGNLRADIGKSRPDYRGTVSIRGLEWLEGRVDLEGELTAAGRGREVGRSLVWQGNFSGADVNFGAPLLADRIEGCFRYADNSLELTSVEAISKDSRWSGRGVMPPSGRVSIELREAAAQSRLVRLTGRIENLEWKSSVESSSNKEPGR